MRPSENFQLKAIEAMRAEAEAMRQRVMSDIELEHRRAEYFNQAAQDETLRIDGWAAEQKLAVNRMYGHLKRESETRLQLLKEQLAQIDGAESEADKPSNVTALSDARH